MHCLDAGLLRSTIDFGSRLFSGALLRPPGNCVLPITCTVNAKHDMAIDSIELTISDGIDIVSVAPAIVLSATERLYCAIPLLEGRELLVSVGRLLIRLRKRLHYVQSCTAQVPNYGILSTEPFVPEGASSFLSLGMILMFPPG